LELKDLPGLVCEGTDGHLDLRKLPDVWRKVAGFEPIPIERIGLLPAETGKSPSDAVGQIP